MSTCKYCGKSAGLFKKYHSDCEALNSSAKEMIKEKIRIAINEGTDFSKLEDEVNVLALSSFVSKQELLEVYGQGFDKAVDHFLEDGVVSETEEEKIAAFRTHFQFDTPILDKNGSLQRIIKASILREILEGKPSIQRIKIDGTLPFLFQNDEILLWVFQNVEFHELRNKTVYHGKSQGVSIKIAKGVYYRAGAFKGNPTTVEQSVHVGTGILALTTKNLYFSSINKTIKIPYNKLITLTPYTDGIGVQKDGATAKPQIFKGIDGWFSYNVVSNLNSK